MLNNVQLLLKIPLTYMCIYIFTFTTPLFSWQPCERDTHSVPSGHWKHEDHWAVWFFGSNKMLRLDVFKFPEQVQLFSALWRPEPEKETLIPSFSADGDGVVIQDGYFSWTPHSPLVLHGINVVVKVGSLVAVVGPIGSGKSSLLAAVLGEMERRGGSISIKVIWGRSQC